jgi:hypothetical protein
MLRSGELAFAAVLHLWLVPSESVRPRGEMRRMPIRR